MVDLAADLLLVAVHPAYRKAGLAQLLLCSAYVLSMLVDFCGALEAGHRAFQTV